MGCQRFQRSVERTCRTIISQGTFTHRPLHGDGLPTFFLWNRKQTWSLRHSLGQRRDPRSWNSLLSHTITRILDSCTKKSTQKHNSSAIISNPSRWPSGFVCWVQHVLDPWLCGFWIDIVQLKPETWSGSSMAASSLKVSLWMVLEFNFNLLERSMINMSTLDSCSQWIRSPKTARACICRLMVALLHDCWRHLHR